MSPPTTNDPPEKRKRRRGKSKDAPSFNRDKAKKHRGPPSRPSSTSSGHHPKHRGGSSTSASSYSTTNPPWRKRSGPSQEAYELSGRLKELSREKKFDEALQLYWDKSNDKIRDSFHACIVVDMSARCGRIYEGEKVVADFATKGKHCNVETKTALLKGYSHSGLLSKADKLFDEMVTSKSTAELPNTRTLNTFLRGCLWSAAGVVGEAGICGGVVSSERAWSKFQKLASDPRLTKNNRKEEVIFDISSYEYSTTLLCLSLNVDEARRRIEEMKSQFGFGSDNKIDQADQSLTEALAMVHVALARSLALLGKYEEAVSTSKEALWFASLSQKALSKDDHVSSKRAWKDAGGKDQQTQDVIDRRTESNLIYRKHRLQEVETEATTVMEICQTKVDKKENVCFRSVARRLATRLVFLSGGGTTESQQQQTERLATEQNTIQEEDSKSIQRRITNSSYYSFGMDTVSKQLGMTFSKPDDSNIALKRKMCNKLLAGIGLQSGIVGSDSRLDIRRIFSAGLQSGKSAKSKSKKSRPLVVELGAGFGDWIVRKAMTDDSKNYIAVELRADRVAQIFARTAILSLDHPVDNMCVVGDDSETFLSRHLGPESVQHIHVNHPEPPTQYGSDDVLESIARGGEEPAHMINSRVILSAIRCLKRNPNSRLTIVTDNKFYGQLISSTIAKVHRQNRSLFSCVDLPKLDSSFKKIDSGSPSNRVIDLFEGQPNETIGFPKQSENSTKGESYFDRLWRAGAGTYADKRKRFIIVLSPQV
mmetsp:Transcript_35286/g.85411  ORF Transcript_35286/g.85411 Transcript_35286/m.85411 type:complete len:765 (-) Transcript_35286:91-2385(-)